MLIVIPVSESDSTLIESFSECLNFFGTYKNHELLVVCRPSDALHGVTLFNKTRYLFKEADIHVFETDGTRGWPQGPNYYWKQTILHLKKDRLNTVPWLWMELDMTPLKRGWIDALESEYKKQKMPCMGWVQNTTTLTTERKVVAIGKHLVGAAIYPPDITVCCDIWEHVDKISTAFDVLCQWQLVPSSFHSDLFQHCFRTQNYKEIAPGVYRGEDNNNFPGDLRFDYPVRDTAVLHHGCDDGTLARLIIDTKEEGTGI